EVADAMTRDFPDAQFDCVVSIATLHHLPMRAVLLKLKQTLRPGGTLIVLDLHQPETRLFSAEGFEDGLLNIIAMSTSCALRLLHNGRLRPPRAVRTAWEEHGKTDSYLTMKEAHSLYSSIFPGVIIRKHLLWRYSAVWRVLPRRRLSR